MIISKHELMDILGVNLEGLKAIEKRNTLNRRLEEIGIILENKKKEGRKVFYHINIGNIELYEKSKIKIKLGIQKYKDYDNFKVDIDKWHDIGVYYILKDNDIYIGSTYEEFRTRFLKHCSDYNIENMKYTYELLQNGATFHILYDMKGIEDVELIRMIENEFIQYFINETNYNVINKREIAWNYNKEVKYKTLKIKLSEDKYEQAMRLLIDNGIIEEQKETYQIII